MALGQAFVLVAVGVLSMVGVRAATDDDPMGLQVVAEASALAEVGQPLTVTATAAGPDPIVSAELRADDSVVAQFDAVDPFANLKASWTPTSSGWSSMEVVVVDAAGRSATSAPITVNVIEPASLPYVVQGPLSDSLDQVAAGLGVSPQDLVDSSPLIGPGEVFGPGSVVFAPHLTESLPAPPGQPSIADGVLTGVGSDGVFLYLTQDGVARRVPDDPAKLLRAGRGGIALGPHLPPLDHSDVAVEVWRRHGNGVDLIAEFLVPAHELWEPVTELHAMLGGPFFPEPIPVKSIQTNTKGEVEFLWSANHPHHGVAWFLAASKPGSSGKVNPSKLLQQGIATGDGGSFSIDMKANIDPTLPTVQEGGGPETFVPLLPSGGAPDKPFNFSELPPLDPLGSTWAWVVPVDQNGKWAGPPSDLVRVVVVPAPYDPADQPPYDVVSVDLELGPAANPALANCVRVVSEYPPFPAYIGTGGFYLNADGTTARKGTGGGKFTGHLPYPKGPDGRAIYPFTACPGETGSTQWGDTGCSWTDVFCHVSKGLGDLSEAAIGFGEFLVDLAGKAVEAYNQLKNWAVSQVASTLCPDAVSGPCETMIAVGVDIMLTTVGIPPTLPEFDDLADLAKGEIVDLALDQLGVGEACDALATTGTGKTCGELATQLENMDACSFAPKGQEDNCRGLVEKAQAACDIVGTSEQCEVLSNDALDLVEAGYGVVVDASLEAIDSQLTEASLESLGFSAYWWNSGEHACEWGPPVTNVGGWIDYPVTCTPWAPGGVFFPPEPPPGCHVGTWGADKGKVLCTAPPADIEALPEPYGQHQPIKVTVVLQRNENPMPEGFQCGPIQAEVTTLNPYGGAGQPYLPAIEPLPTGQGLFGTGTHVLTLWLSEPNPHVSLPAEKKPPVPEILQSALDAIGGSFSSVETQDWKHLLVGGSLAGVKVTANCITPTQGGGEFGVAGVIPPARPRMTPGAAE